MTHGDGCPVAVAVESQSLVESKPCLSSQDCGSNMLCQSTRPSAPLTCVCIDRYVFKDDGNCGKMVHLTAVFSTRSAVSTVHPSAHALRKLLKCENAVHALGKSLKCENAAHALGKSLKCENAAHALGKSLKCENAASSCLEEITEV